MAKQLAGTVVLTALCLGACTQSTSQPAASGTTAVPAAAPAQSPDNSAATALQPPAAAQGGTAAVAASPADAAAAPSASSPSAAAGLTAPAAAGTRAQSEPAVPTAVATTPAPRLRELTIPSGTPLSIKLSTGVASDTSKVEDTVRGTLTRAVTVEGLTALPAGTAVIGTVASAEESGRVQGKAQVSFRFTRLMLDEESHSIRTALISREAESSTKDDVKKGGIGAGAGAIVGGIIGGGKGAAIGAGVGGTGAVLATKGKEVRLEPGDVVSTTLQNALTVTVSLAP